LAIDLSTVIQYLNAVSALAVTAGVFFVIFQLRQNAKLIEASNKQIETANRQVEASVRQTQQELILSIIDRFTDDSFIRKRKRVRDIVKKHQENGWKDFLESDDDYEVRGFLGLYDSTGYLAKNGMADIRMLTDGMGFLAITDWVATEPVINHYLTTWKQEVYSNFKWCVML
jgi:hypothetical protein